MLAALVLALTCLLLTPPKLSAQPRDEAPRRRSRDDRPPRREEGRPNNDRNRRLDQRTGGQRPREDRPASQRYSLQQACSDKAQLHTIAFNGLAFLTGDFGAATFIPPGKVCDFFGFQYMRDIDAAEKGHNPMFLGRVAANVIHTLNENQKQLFRDLAEEQGPQLEALARMRLPLIQAFHLQRDGQLPSGSPGLNKQAVVDYVGEIFARDAELSLRRAEVMAEVYRSLEVEQQAYLGLMEFGNFDSWPELDEREMRERRPRSESPLYRVAYMTYASEFFSWTAGSLQADTYFCPERHGTYFGGFYMKDMPAMGKRDYDISTSITGESGQAFLYDVLTDQQRKYMTVIPDLQRKALAEIVTVRKDISTELRKLHQGETPNRQKVVELGRRYGELDGEMSWYYTMAFSRINGTLTDRQRSELKKLRNLEGYESAAYYIYSRGVDSPPELGDVNPFFFAPKKK